MLENCKSIEDIEKNVEDEIRKTIEVFTDYNATTEKTLSLLEEFSRRIKKNKKI